MLDATGLCCFKPMNTERAQRYAHPKAHRHVLLLLCCDVLSCYCSRKGSTLKPPTTLFLTYFAAHSASTALVLHGDRFPVFKIVAYSMSCLLVYRSVPMVRAIL